MQLNLGGGAGAYLEWPWATGLATTNFNHFNQTSTILKFYTK
jgi:hypothetical protein